MKKKMTDYLLETKSKQGIIIINQAGIISGIDNYALQLLMFNRDDIINNKLQCFLNNKLTIVSLDQKDDELTELELLNKNDDIIKVTAKIESLYLKGEELYLISFIEIDSQNSEIDISLFDDLNIRPTEKKQTMDELINYDFLTGLPDRSLFSDRLKEDLRLAKKQEALVAVLFIDLDNFKKVNDSLGHQMGDRLLNSAAQKLHSLITDNDFLARLSGDEFGIIINGRENIKQISNLLEYLVSNFSQPFKISDANDEATEIFITLSIGAAIFPNDSENMEELIKNSEIAKNEVKENGKNNYQFYSDEMNQEALQDLELEAKLRHAIDNQEFVLHYQPQIDLERGRVFGVEALIRWEDEELGLVPPSKFIPIAERTGLIIPIGDWVLKEACLEAKKFHEAGFSDLKMGINLSARQFADDHLVENIEAILSETGLDATALELEITESIIMEDVHKSVGKLIKLKDLGVNFSIDDFGTGYSSLSYLKEFPIGTLKIDRSFVAKVPSDKDDTAIVKAIIDLAHNLDLNVIAEGVEEIEHVDFLEENNCDRIQGYYFGRPMTKEKVIEFLSNDLWKIHND